MDQAFRHSGRVMTALGTLGGADILAYAINQRGDIAWASATGGGLQHAYVWRGACAIKRVIARTTTLTSRRGGGAPPA